MNIQCDNIIVERRPDIVIVNKMGKTAIIIDVAIPGDKGIMTRTRRRLKSIRASKEIQRLWKLKKFNVIPVILGALGSVTKNFEKYVDKIGIKVDLHTVQKNHIIGDRKNIEESARMLAKEKVL